MSSHQRCKTHKYRRFSLAAKNKRHDIYYCVSCPSYKHMTMMIGSHTICWKCGNEFVIGNKAQLKPLCEDCRLKAVVVKVEPAMPDIKNIVDSIMDKI